MSWIVNKASRLFPHGLSLVLSRRSAVLRRTDPKARDDYLSPLLIGEWRKSWGNLATVPLTKPRTVRRVGTPESQQVIKISVLHVCSSVNTDLLRYVLTVNSETSTNKSAEAERLRVASSSTKNQTVLPVLRNGWSSNVIQMPKSHRTPHIHVTASYRSVGSQ